MDKIARVFAESANDLDDEAARVELLGEPPPDGVTAGVLRLLAGSFREIAGELEAARNPAA